MPTAIDWPTTGSFPQSPRGGQSSGYKTADRETVVHFSPDSGPVISRRTALTAPVPYDCVFDLTTSQLATYRTWWTDTVFDGSLSFNFPHPETGTPFEAKILKPAETTHLGGLNWQISLTVWDVYA